MVDKTNLKERAITLRKSGYSYGLINSLIQVPKSTLSGWLKDVLFTPNKISIERIKQGHRNSASTRKKNKEKKLEILKNNLRSEYSDVFDSELFLFGLGLGLYWGDGKKYGSTVCIANSDPRMLRAFINWLETICGVPKADLRVQLHLHQDVDPKKAVKYWRNKLCVQTNQFYKIMIDKRKGLNRKKGKLKYGTAHIYMISKTRKTLELHRKILLTFEMLGKIRGSSSMVERLPSKQDTGVRFSSPAHIRQAQCKHNAPVAQGIERLSSKQ